MHEPREQRTNRSIGDDTTMSVFIDGPDVRVAFSDVGSGAPVSIEWIRFTPAEARILASKLELVAGKVTET